MNTWENDYIKVLERAGSDAGGIALWKCLCKNCGNIFVARGSNLRNGDTKSCGCVHSLNEKKIVGLLTDAEVEFSTQYTFADLKGTHGGALRFDFAIFSNGQLSHLIEFNGKQHYEKSEGHWGEGYEDLRENDARKASYCASHNIPLVIIKYDQNYNLSDLLL